MARLLAETTRGCSTLRRNKTLTILTVALGIALSGCNRPGAPAAAAAPHGQSKSAMDPAPAVRASPELVEVWVAARDLPVGTVFTRDELSRLAVRKKLPKDALPPAYVANPEEFIDRPLTRLASKDAPFDPDSFGKFQVVQVPEGLDLVALSWNGDSPVARYVLPGARVDVRATLNHSNGSANFPLLVNVLVLAVDSNLTNPPSQSVSLAATQEQALVLTLARERDCKFDILPRLPGKMPNIGYDIKRVAALLQDDTKLATFLKAKAAPLSTAPSIPEPITAPRELTDVWVAVGDIPPKAVITRQLVDAKLRRIKVSKERAEGAIRDLTCLFDQGLTLEPGLRQGQWLTASLVGRPQPAGEAESEEVEVAPMPRAMKPKVYKDVTITTPSGKRIYRYEEVAPDQFKLVGEFVPDNPRKAAGRAVTPPKKGNR
jgi:Flp pilus assembly protein CpaB